MDEPIDSVVFRVQDNLGLDASVNQRNVKATPEVAFTFLCGTKLER